MAVFLISCGSNTCTQDSLNALQATAQNIQQTEGQQLQNDYSALNSGGTSAQSACQSTSTIKNDVQSFIDNVNGTDCSAINASTWGQIQQFASQLNSTSMTSINQVIQYCQSQKWL